MGIFGRNFGKEYIDGVQRIKNAEETLKNNSKRIKKVEKTLKNNKEILDDFRSLFYNFYWDYKSHQQYYDAKKETVIKYNKFFNQKKLETECKLSEIDYLINQLRKQVSDFEKYKREQVKRINELEKVYMSTTEAMNETVKFLHQQQREQVKEWEHATSASVKAGQQQGYERMINYLVNHFDIDREALIEFLKEENDD